MIGLATGSVAVIDDQPEEALPLIRAFSSAGIGTIYLSGRPDEFPQPDSIRGIRLVALDINLSGAEMDDEATAHLPVQVLEAIMRRSNGPYMVLLWTTRIELADLFKEFVKEIEWPPVSTFVLAKEEVKDGNGEFSLELITPKIMEGIRNAHPLQVMMLWGQIVHDAASSTLSALGPEPTGEWMSGVNRILSALVRENTPKASLSDQARCMMGLFGALDQIFTDELEAAATRIPDDEKDCMEEIVRNAASATGNELASHMNRKLLLGRVIDKKGAPGSVYLASKLVDTLGNDLSDLLTDTLDKPGSTPSKAQLTRYEAATKYSVLLAVEITPVCDYQQDKHRLVRLLGGLAVPTEHEKAILGSTDYIRRFPRIKFDEADLHGEYTIAWNAHFLVTRNRGAFHDHEPEYRVRQAPLSDLIAFHANSSARPGYLSIRA